MLLLGIFISSCSAGSIEVSLATMSKDERNHTDEVYVVGFVPTYKIRKRTAISLDPFLEPVIQEIENGFIEGSLLLFFNPRVTCGNVVSFSF